MALLLTQITVLVLTFTMLLTLRIDARNQKHMRLLMELVNDMAKTGIEMSEAIEATNAALMEVVDALVEEDVPISPEIISALRQRFRN